MSRRRYISTTMSTDKRLNRLAVEYGDFAAMLYTWMIPHAADDTTLNGDVEELMAEVIPMRRDKTVQDVEDALNGMASLGLVIRDIDAGTIRFPSAAFYAHQSFIRRENRREDWPEPEIRDDHRETPQKAVSLSSSLSSSVSVSPPVSPPAPDTSASGEARKRAPRPKAVELVPLSEAEADELAEKYADIPEVRDKIATALEHRAHLKYPTGQKQYVNNWLSKERQYLTPIRENGNANGTRNGNGARTGFRISADEAERNAQLYASAKANGKVIE